MLPRLALLALVGCADIKEIGGGWGVDLSWIPGVGQVFQCEADEQEFEFCYRGEANELAQQIVAAGLSAGAACRPTQRHLGPCFWSCEPHRGCNAFQGCWGCE